ncbi:MAG: hypothetical protein N3A38_14520, partial [Planctomycetota bacterium]|nr:hypothetical protein [Planctomycetota bacterium]
MWPPRALDVLDGDMARLEAAGRRARLGGRGIEPGLLWVLEGARAGAAAPPLSPPLAYSAEDLAGNVRTESDSPWDVRGRAYRPYWSWRAYSDLYGWDFCDRSETNPAPAPVLKYALPLEAGEAVALDTRAPGYVKALGGDAQYMARVPYFGAIIGKCYDLWGDPGDRVGLCYSCDSVYGAAFRLRYEGGNKWLGGGAAGGVVALRAGEESSGSVRVKEYVGSLLDGWALPKYYDWPNGVEMHFPAWRGVGPDWRIEWEVRAGSTWAPEAAGHRDIEHWELMGETEWRSETVVEQLEGRGLAGFVEVGAGGGAGTLTVGLPRIGERPRRIKLEAIGDFSRPSGWQYREEETSDGLICIYEWNGYSKMGMALRGVGAPGWEGGGSALGSEYAELWLRSGDDPSASPPAYAQKPGIQAASYGKAGASGRTDDWYGKPDAFNFVRVRAVPMPADSKYACEANCVKVYPDGGAGGGQPASGGGAGGGSSGGRPLPPTGTWALTGDDPDATSTVLAGHVTRIVIE